MSRHSQTREVMVKKHRTTLVVLAAALVMPSNLLAQWKTPWDYEGPRGADHWSEIDPAYAACNSGKEQSPIDIRDAEKANLPPLRFEYKSEPLKYLINNGKTIRVNYHDSPDSGSFMTVGEKRYQLTQFHFHHPSEETINGKAYAMEVHFMHQASNGAIVGVTVFVKQGKGNATVHQLWDHMPMTESKEIEIAGVEINPAKLLPRNTAYYQYIGSVTAPPCTEGVTWYVLKTPIEISAEQIEAFAKLYTHDARPVQPLNGRVVTESR
jgi:carbonic anhydrase